MDQLAGRDRRLDRVEEADELLVPVALHAVADDRAVEHVERGEQRGGAVALVVMGHRAGRPFFIGRPGWVRSSAWICDLLVDREHDGMRRRVDIEPDHVAQLGGERRVRGQLEGPDPMRRKPVRRPDPLHGAQARCRWPRPSPGPSSASPRPGGSLSVRSTTRSTVSAGSGGMPGCGSCRAAGHPRLRRMNRSCQRQTLGFALPVRRMISAVPQPVGRDQDDPRPPDVLLRAVPVRHDRRQPRTVRRRSPRSDPLAHAAAYRRTGQQKETYDCVNPLD